VNFFVRDAASSFALISLLVTGACLPLIWRLGRRMFGQAAASMAVLLLLLNPVFWQSGLDGPLRPFLALFSLGTAYCAWRAWNGEERYVLWGAFVLGVGTGFRPDLAAYLAPVWLISAVVGARSYRRVGQGIRILVGVVLIWVGVLAVAVGGIRQLYALLTEYLVDQSKTDSVLLGASQTGALRQLSRLVTWNGLAVVGWVWTVPFVLAAKEKLREFRPHLLFTAVWLIPGLAFQAAVHVAAPGHTLFSIPAWCLLGGWALQSAAEKLAPGEPSRLAAVSFAAALSLNLLLFLNYFPLPAAPAAPSFLSSLKNAAAFATYESSLAMVRSMDDVADVTMKELRDATGSSLGGRPWVIVTTNETPNDWFMHWLLLRYYAPRANIWVAAEELTPKQAFLTRRGQTLETHTGDTIKIPVPMGGRVVWILESGGAFERELLQTQHPESRRRIAITDIGPDAQPFRVRSFEFVPTQSHGIQ
jgi:4-amino-4-deoxy-L-arabinose transferase-like glycosyltransferase